MCKNIKNVQNQVLFLAVGAEINKHIYTSLLFPLSFEMSFNIIHFSHSPFILSHSPFFFFFQDFPLQPIFLIIFYPSSAALFSFARFLSTFFFTAKLLSVSSTFIPILFLSFSYSSSTASGRSIPSLTNSQTEGTRLKGSTS